jgi:hypothetical protein
LLALLVWRPSIVQSMRKVRVPAVRKFRSRLLSLTAHIIGGSKPE